LDADQIKKLTPESVTEEAIKQAIEALPNAVEAAVKRHVLAPCRHKRDQGVGSPQSEGRRVDTGVPVRDNRNHELPFQIAPRVTATNPPSLSDSGIDQMGISALISALIWITLKHHFIHCNTVLGRGA
jgi:hypothetical protein